MSINSSGRKLEGFFTGKGFYIVLFLCAAVIGLSAWMMATGNEAMQSEANSMNIGASRVETVIIPPQAEEESLVPVIAPEEAEVEAVIAPEEEISQVWNEDEAAAVEAPLYIWPVQGEAERLHDLEKLSYDVTLKDWRTHNGVDIGAPLGTSVAATCAGSVLSVEEDSLYGTVVTIDHGDGILSVYANLEAMPFVSAGEWVEAGDTIGAVGSTALCEVAQLSHLHFAMSVDGASVDPLEYLP